MIIGIDETGTFDLANDSMSFFVGVHVLDKNQEAKLASGLEVWKNKYRSLKKNNEIKSSALTPEIAFDFIEMVLDPMD